MQDMLLYILVMISIHALARSATAIHTHLMNVAVIFQSTHSRGVRRFLGESQTEAFIFQSTHSRGVRPGFVMSSKLNQLISIHALARSATAVGKDSWDIVKISIHALARSATKECVQHYKELIISIHALARSATP